MKWFTRKPKLTDADPARRLRAVAGLDAAEQEALTAIARNDADAAVRSAAMERLQPPALGVLLQEAEARADRAGAFDIAARLAVLDGGQALGKHPLLAVVACVQSPSRERVADIADAGWAAFAVLRVAEAEARVALAGAEWNEERLVALEASARNRDKAVHRLAKDRLAALKQLRRERADLVERAEALIAAAQRLSAEPQVAGRAAALGQQWDAVCRQLEENAGALKPFGVAADADALHGRFRLPEPAPAQAGQDAPPESFDALLAELSELERAALATEDSGQDLPAIGERMAAINERWNELAEAKPPPASVAAPYREGRLRLRDIHEAAMRAEERRAEAARLLTLDATFHTPKQDEEYAALWRRQTAARRGARDADGLVEAIAWPPAIPAPAWLGELAEHAQALRALDQRCHEAFTALQTEAAEAIAAMEAAAEAGEVHDAQRRRAHAGRCIRRLPKAAQDGPAGKLASRSARLRELTAWQTFAERGKREALCEEMESLADNPLAVEAQVERIKTLRESVQALGRTRAGADRALMERFDAAAERAFQPCREHFKALAERRRFNLAQRETICRELEAFVEHNDWAHADYKGVDQILRRARAEWREYRPVDRGPGRKLDARFKTVTNQLHGYMKADWDRNVAAKEAIVAKAQTAVADGRPTAEVIELLKRLQRDWKEVGPTPRRRDQELWKTFRGICDHAFGARDAERQERRSKSSSAVAEANALVEALQSAMSEDAIEAPDRHMLADYARQAEALTQLPREVERRLQRALSDFEREVALASARRRMQQELDRIDRLEALDAQLAGLEAEAADAAGWQAEARDLASVFAPRSERQAEADADAVKRLVVEAEVAAEMESPEADKALRMEVQLQRLRSGLGGRYQDRADSAELLERWCASAVAADAALRERFFKAVRRIAKR